MSLKNYSKELVKKLFSLILFFSFIATFHAQEDCTFGFLHDEPGNLNAPIYYLFGFKIQVDDKGILKSTHVGIHNDANRTIQFKAAIYADRNGSPGELISTSVITETSSSRIYLELELINKPEILPDTYWLLVVSNADGRQFLANPGSKVPYFGKIISAFDNVPSSGIDFSVEELDFQMIGYLTLSNCETLDNEDLVTDNITYIYPSVISESDLFLTINNFKSNQTEDNIKIYDVNGKLVYNEEIVMDQNLRIDLQKIKLESNASYLLIVNDKESYRFIKK